MLWAKRPVRSVHRAGEQMGVGEMQVVNHAPPLLKLLSTDIASRNGELTISSSSNTSMTMLGGVAEAP